MDVDQASQGLATLASRRNQQQQQPQRQQRTAEDLKRASPCSPNSVLLGPESTVHSSASSSPEQTRDAPAPLAELRQAPADAMPGTSSTPSGRPGHSMTDGAVQTQKPNPARAAAAQTDPTDKGTQPYNGKVMRRTCWPHESGCSSASRRRTQCRCSFKMRMLPVLWA